MVIDVLGKLAGAQEFKIFERLPAIFHRVKRGVENNAVRVQMRIKRAGSFMGEQRGGKITGQSVAPCTLQPKACGSKFFKFPQRTAHRPTVCSKNAFIRAKEGRQ